MSDSDLLSRAIGIVAPKASRIYGFFRNGRLLLALPGTRGPAMVALGLYQPQRPAARLVIGILKAMVVMGMHRWVLPRMHVRETDGEVVLPLIGIRPDTCGVLFGSHEHAVCRVIACYLNDGKWEVAKVSFGEDGSRMLASEAGALVTLHGMVAGVPPLLGLHQGTDATVLRMPRLTGQPLKAGNASAALQLLERWILPGEPMSATTFDEWKSIAAALSNFKGGDHALNHISERLLQPVVRHGDFARWNLLRQSDGSLLALDWEWGGLNGMPGLDLVHFFLQEARLVKRQNPTAAIETTIRELDHPACRDYLSRTGWTGESSLPIIACLAYKQGAGHQQNQELLKIAVEMMA
ncbi:MAG: hypothetical protein V4733_00600 [Verrucomicrobiota bacterium]